MVYQPKLDLRTGVVVGAEALVQVGLTDQGFGRPGGVRAGGRRHRA